MSPTSRAISLLSQHLVNLLDHVEPAWRRAPLPGWGDDDALRAALSAGGIATLGDLTAIDPLALLALAAVPRPPDATSAPEDAAFWPAAARAVRERIMPVVELRVVALLVGQVARTPHPMQGGRTASPSPGKQERDGDVSEAEHSRIPGDDEASDAEPGATESGFSSLLADSRVAFDAANKALREPAYSEDWGGHEPHTIASLADLARIDLYMSSETPFEVSAECVQYHQGPTEMSTATGKLVVPLAGRDLAATPLLSWGVLTALRDLGCDLNHTTLSTLNLSVRTFNTCHRSGMRTLDELARKTPKDLLDIRNFGVKSFQEVHDSLLGYLNPWLDRVPLEVLVPGTMTGQSAPLPIIEGGVP